MYQKNCRNFQYCPDGPICPKPKKAPESLECLYYLGYISLPFSPICQHKSQPRDPRRFLTSNFSPSQSFVFMHSLLCCNFKQICLFVRISLYAMLAKGVSTFEFQGEYSLKSIYSESVTKFEKITHIDFTFTKGQLISKRNFVVFKSPKKRTQFLKDFCPSL